MEVNNLRKKALFMVAILLASTLVIGLKPAKAEVEAPDIDIGEDIEIPDDITAVESEFDGNISRIMETNTFLPGETIVVEGQFLVQHPDAVLETEQGNVTLFNSDVEAGDPITSNVFTYDTSGDLGLAFSGNNPTYEDLPIYSGYMDLDNDGNDEWSPGAMPSSNISDGYMVSNHTIPVNSTTQSVAWKIGIRFTNTSEEYGGLNYNLPDAYRVFIAGGRDWTALPGLEEGDTFTVGEKELTLESKSELGAVFSNSSEEEFTVKTIETRPVGMGDMIDVDKKWGNKFLDIDGDGDSTVDLSVSKDGDIGIFGDEDRVNTTLTPQLEDETTIKDGDTLKGLVLEKKTTNDSDGFLSALSLDSKSNYVVVPQENSITASKGSVSSMDVKVAKTSHMNIGPIKIPRGSEEIYTGPLKDIGSEVEELDLEAGLEKVKSTVDNETGTWKIEKATIDLNSENLEVNTEELEGLYTNEDLFDLGPLKDRSFILPVSTVDWGNFLGVNN